VHALLALGAPTYTLDREQWLPGSLQEVFAFYEDPRNLARITPGRMGFRIVKMQPPTMGQGVVIDYRLTIFGLPARWRSLIEAWEPPRRFVDLQLSGPYILWRHEHRFEEQGGGVLVRDRVDYRLPFGPLGAVAHGLAVRRELERIFDYRAQVTADLLGDGRVLRHAPAA